MKITRISLIRILSKRLAEITLHLCLVPEKSFRSGRITLLTLCMPKVLGHRHTFRRPEISFLLNLKAAFNISLAPFPTEEHAREIQFTFLMCMRTVEAKSMPTAIYQWSSPREAVGRLKEIVISSYENSGISICSGDELPELQHADDVGLLSEGKGKLEVFSII